MGTVPSDRVLFRDLLIQHIDGTRIEFPGKYSRLRKLTRVLIERGCLEPIGNPADPACTLITNKGRAELAKALARQAEELSAAIDDYSDALSRVGLDALAQQVKAARWPFRGESRPTLPVPQPPNVSVSADVSIT